MNSLLSPRCAMTTCVGQMDCISDLYQVIPIDSQPSTVINTVFTMISGPRSPTVSHISTSPNQTVPFSSQPPITKSLVLHIPKGSLTSTVEHSQRSISRSSHDENDHSHQNEPFSAPLYSNLDSSCAKKPTRRHTKKLKLLRGCHRQLKRLLRNPGIGSTTVPKCSVPPDEHTDLSECRRCHANNSILTDLQTKYSDLCGEVCSLRRRLAAVQHAFTSLRTMLLAAFPVTLQQTSGLVTSSSAVSTSGIMDTFQMGSSAPCNAPCNSESGVFQVEKPEVDTMKSVSNYERATHAQHTVETTSVDCRPLVSISTARDMDSALPSTATPSVLTSIVSTSHTLECTVKPAAEEGSIVGDEVVDTYQLVSLIRQRMQTLSVSQRMLARTLNGISQKRISDLLRNPRPWSQLSPNVRTAYEQLYHWARDHGNNGPDLSKDTAQNPLDAHSPSLAPASVRSTDTSPWTTSGVDDVGANDHMPAELNAEADHDNGSPLEPCTSPSSLSSIPTVGSNVGYERKYLPYADSDTCKHSSGMTTTMVTGGSHEKDTNALCFSTPRRFPSTLDTETQQRIRDILMAARQAMALEKSDRMTQSVESQQLSCSKRRKRASGSDISSCINLEPLSNGVTDVLSHTSCDTPTDVKLHLLTTQAQNKTETVIQRDQVLPRVSTVSFPHTTLSSTQPGICSVRVLPSSHQSRNRNSDATSFSHIGRLPTAPVLVTTSTAHVNPALPSPAVVDTFHPAVSLIPPVTVAQPVANLISPLQQTLMFLAAATGHGTNTANSDSTITPLIHSKHQDVTLPCTTPVASSNTTTAVSELTSEPSVTICWPSANVLPVSKTLLPVSMDSVSPASEQLANIPVLGPSDSFQQTVPEDDLNKQQTEDDLTVNQIRQLSECIPPLDPFDLSARVKSILREFNISQRLLGEHVLNMPQATVSDILNKPRQWSLLSPRPRIAYFRLHLWLQQPNGAESIKLFDAIQRSRFRGVSDCPAPDEVIDPNSTLTTCNENETLSVRKRNAPRTVTDQALCTRSKLARPEAVEGETHTVDGNRLNADRLAEYERQSLFDIAKAATVAMQRANFSGSFKYGKNKSDSPAKSNSGSSRSNTPLKVDVTALAVLKTDSDPTKSVSTTPTSPLKVSPIRHRSIFTPVQKEALVAAFARQPYPPSDGLRKLAKDLDLSYKTVLNWFHNRRMRSRQPPTLSPHLVLGSTRSNRLGGSALNAVQPLARLPGSPIRNCDQVYSAMLSRTTAVNDNKTESALESSSPARTTCPVTQLGHQNRRKRPDPARLIAPCL